MSVLIINYGMGNLGSVKRSFEECGAPVFISDDPKDLSDASAIVLPGVGAFGDGMTHLHERGWVSELQSQVLKNKIPLLGVCLGMQLLAFSSEEAPGVEGLNFIPGQVCKLRPKQNERIPHVGWNEVHPTNDSKMFQFLEAKSDFYFVHSFHFCPDDAAVIAARTPYCGEFVSAVQKDQVWGVQFHPEKSSKPGFQLIKNFLQIARVS